MEPGGAESKAAAEIERLIAAARDAGDLARAMRVVLDAAESDPSLVAEYADLADEAALPPETDLAFAWACAELRAYTYALPIEHPDWVRERYQELLALHRGEPDRLALLRRVGLRIGELEAAGDLPQSLVVRTR